MDDFKEQFRNQLRVLLAKKELTNHWLAQQLKVSDMTVSRWTTNKSQPSMSQFIHIGRLLNVELKDLIEADDVL